MGSCAFVAAGVGAGTAAVVGSTLGTISAVAVGPAVAVGVRSTVVGSGSADGWLLDAVASDVDSLAAFPQDTPTSTRIAIPRNLKFISCGLRSVRIAAVIR